MESVYSMFTYQTTALYIHLFSSKDEYPEVQQIYPNFFVLSKYVFHVLFGFSWGLNDSIIIPLTKCKPVTVKALLQLQMSFSRCIKLKCLPTPFGTDTNSPPTSETILSHSFCQETETVVIETVTPAIILQGRNSPSK